MAKRILLCVCCLCVIALSGCSELMSVPSDARAYVIAEYDLFWSETYRSGYTKVVDGVTYGVVPPLYPADISECEVIHYTCQADSYFPLGDTRQLYLTIRFPDSDSFLAEQNRLKANHEDVTHRFHAGSRKAYADRMGEKVWSYALVDPDANTVTYVYYEGSTERQIWFSRDDLPEDFKQS